VDAVHAARPPGRLTGVNPQLYERPRSTELGGGRACATSPCPAIAPVVAVAVLFRALDAFKLFDLVFMFTQGGPRHLDRVDLVVHLQLGFRFFRLGYASAVSYVAWSS
jgi:ABC-type sugar transport system permease subunit